MFNTPILDIALGLVFIFLLYSLLATSINEAIATALALRARMLKKGIAEAMLSNTSEDNRWKSLLKGIGGFWLEFWYFLKGSKPQKEVKKLGDYFYEHPIIKNYGSNRIFPLPSYIPSGNFTTVLFDLLKQDFQKKLPEITKDKVTRKKLPLTEENLTKTEQELTNSTDIVKIKSLLEYYGNHYINNETPPSPLIDKDTWHILQLHLQESLYDIEKFSKKLESWFDDSMDRVSGWYKRQTQTILFVIGLAAAFIFNIDTIEISGKLSKDKDLRDQMVKLAINAPDKYKADHRISEDGQAQNAAKVKKAIAADSSKADSVIAAEYKKSLNDARNVLKSDSIDITSLLSLGWQDYGRNDTTYQRRFYHSFDSSFCMITHPFKALVYAAVPDTVKTLANSKKINTKDYNAIIDKHPVIIKTWYVKQFIGPRKLLGLLITAFAIALGAPFWFDLLNKLVNLRAAGKKENDGSGNSNAGNRQITTAPVTVKLTTNSGEEAEG